MLLKFTTTISLVLLAITPSTASAKGCLRGAAAGAVAGHYAHHHAVLGAMGGCAAGHMYYKHKAHTTTRHR